MPDSALKTAPAGAANFTYPLSDFYSRAKLPMPGIATISGDEVPLPYKPLLVHGNDMTPTLEEHHKSRIHLEILSRDRRGDFYYREVVLRLDHDEKPVEFGANKVHLGAFPEDAQELILLEQVPLGTILRDCGVRHQTTAKFFLRVEPDELIAKALELEQPTTLYGRKALIADASGRPLSEIVEILPTANSH